VLEIHSQKYLPPASASRLLMREHALIRLAQADAYRIVLLRSPAGYGKTSLLRLIHAGLAQSAAQPAWLTFDQSDNDPARLLLSLRAALVTAPPGDQPAYAALSSSSVTHLFLDDVERLDREAIGLLLSLIVETLPRSMRICVAARGLHGISVAALKAKQILFELTMDDLRFDRSETQAYLRHANLYVEDADIDRLQHATEGWPAAIELTAQAWQRVRGGVSAGFPAVDGLGELGDYLADEVFLSQDEPVRAFLVSTALLDSFCPALADSVRASGDSAELVARVRAAGLPIQPVADGWFRYHPLFAEHIVRHHGPPAASQRAIHARAASWMLAQRGAFDAIDYFFKAGDLVAAADALASLAMPLWLRAQFPSLTRWCDQLPEHLILQRPWLARSYLTALIYSPRQHDAERWLDHFRHHAALDGADPVFADAVRSCEPLLALSGGDLARGAALAMRNWPLQAHANPLDRGILAIVLAYVQLTCGALKEAAAILIEAKGDLARSGHLTGLAIVSFLHAFHDAIEGNFDSAETQLSTIDTLAKEHEGTIAPSLLYTYSAGLILMVAYERNQLGQLSKQLALVRGIASLSRPWDSLNGLLIVQARMMAIEEGPAVAMRWLDLELMKCGAGHPPQVRMALEGELSRLAIVSGNATMTAAYAHVLLAKDWSGQQRSIFPSQEVDGAGIAQLRLMLTVGDAAQAIEQLRALLAHAMATGRTWRATKLRLLLALAAARLEQPQLAHSYLVGALEQGAESGMIRLFLDEGPAMLAMLRRLHAEQANALPAPVARHLEQLLKVAQGSASLAPLPASRLTQTERDLLALVAKGMSNRDVGASLNISINTVKWYMAQIFQKFDVRSRGQAVFKARECGLIA
jgi:LuxR family maltose regulon positive regulatory protein